MNVLIINGPNLNLLGIRDTSIYGNHSFEDYFEELKNKYLEHHLEYRQSNHEGQLIDWLHEFGFEYDGIILNPGAYTHYSYAIADAVLAIETPVVEVHISNIYEREEFRRISLIKPHALTQIFGKGLKGYEMAMDVLIQQKKS